MAREAFALQRLAYAMAVHEGWSAPGDNNNPSGSVSYRNNNPLNLRSSPFMHKSVGGFAQFETEMEGWAAAIYDLRQKALGNTTTRLNGSSTIRDLIYVWAPPTDNNNTEAYIAHVCKLTGFTKDTTLSSLL